MSKLNDIRLWLRLDQIQEGQMNDYPIAADKLRFKDLFGDDEVEDNEFLIRHE